MDRLKLYLMIGTPGRDGRGHRRVRRVHDRAVADRPRGARHRALLREAQHAARRRSRSRGSTSSTGRLERLRRGLKGRADVRSTSAKWAWVEYVLAQGGEAEGLAVIDAVDAGGSFRAYARRSRGWRRGRRGGCGWRRRRCVTLFAWACRRPSGWASRPASSRPSRRWPGARSCARRGSWSVLPTTPGTSGQGGAVVEVKGRVASAGQVVERRLAPRDAVWLHLRIEDHDGSSSTVLLDEVQAVAFHVDDGSGRMARVEPNRTQFAVQLGTEPGWGSGKGSGAGARAAGAQTREGRRAEPSGVEGARTVRRQSRLRPGTRRGGRRAAAIRGLSSGPLDPAGAAQQGGGAGSPSPP